MKYFIGFTIALSVVILIQFGMVITLERQLYVSMHDTTQAIDLAKEAQEMAMKLVDKLIETNKTTPTATSTVSL